MSNPDIPNFMVPCRILVSGAILPFVPAKEPYYGLKELQGAVGGYIELVGLSKTVQDKDGLTHFCTMVVNENGLNENLPLNRLASHFAGQVIVGDVALIRNDMLDEGGDDE